ncbi:HAD hydrolase-like protein [Mycobacterium sp. Y57]|nr:HAD family hydrolase [Mycolicibacterium xanthum]MBX7432128.1 HAD hydrolase-like protein [Mycolicibacterium xanthum]
MQPTQQKIWRAGRFWWDWPQPGETKVQPLRAMIFDLDALADLDSAGHRPAFNAAFAELGLDVEWSESRYRQLQVLSDERRRVAAELRKRGICTECDVLAELLVDEICVTKEMILGETILDADISPRAGLVDLITEAFGAGIGIGVVSNGSHAWVEPLVRQLVGEGVAGVVVTGDDAHEGNLFAAALAELGIAGADALAFVGTHIAERAATVAGMPTVAIDRDDVAGAPLRMAECRRIHDHWRDSHRPSAA